MTSTVSLFDEQKPGLSPLQLYEAIVVDNNDPQKRGRIKARVRILFEGIEDSDLPWAIPTFEHTDGASSESGILVIPKINSKVLLHFQNGSPFHPIYRGYTIDNSTMLEEGNHHYPNRAMIRFKNSLLVVVDTESNEVFIRNPGDTHILIEGNLETTVMGKHVHRVDKEHETIVNGDRKLRVKGDNLELYNSKYTLCVVKDYKTYIRGSSYRRVKTNSQDEVLATRITSTIGNNYDISKANYQRSTYNLDEHIVLGSHNLFVSGSSGHYCSNTIKRNATLILDNSSASPVYTSPYTFTALIEPTEPTQVAPYVWPGILRDGLPKKLWPILQFW